MNAHFCSFLLTAYLFLGGEFSALVFYRIISLSSLTAIDAVPIGPIESEQLKLILSSSLIISTRGIDAIFWHSIHDFYFQ